MKWKHVKEFNSLTASEVYKILKLRQDIFIIEQDCIYDDIDNLDQHSEHLMLSDGETLIAYLRIVPPGKKFENYSIGRVIVKKRYRGKNLGRQIMKKSLSILKDRNAEIVKIEAQEYLLDFYRSLGFNAISDSYAVDGIPHIEMKIQFG
ncbi:MAG: GNAT family N-acetyltransferase [Balneolaceae bacterium]|nr:MAG: GNAT family N-acetyltransferase [Balneolaceae bacterium]